MRKRGNWSVTDLERLRAGFGRRPLAQLARELRRTEATIVQKARRMFGGDHRPGPLDEADEVLLREMVGVADLETMALVLRRAPAEVLAVLKRWAARRQRGRYRRWELDHLRRFGASRPDWALGLVLGRDPAHVRRKAAELGIGRDRRRADVVIPELLPAVVVKPAPPCRMPRWTTEETARLRLLFPHRPNLEIARILGRSVSSIVAKANELGLRKTRRRLAAMGRENAGRRRGRRAARS